MRPPSKPTSSKRLEIYTAPSWFCTLFTVVFFRLIVKRYPCQRSLRNAIDLCHWVFTLVRKIPSPPNTPPKIIYWLNPFQTTALISYCNNNTAAEFSGCPSFHPISLPYQSKGFFCPIFRFICCACGTVIIASFYTSLDVGVSPPQKRHDKLNW